MIHLSDIETNSRICLPPVDDDGNVLPNREDDVNDEEEVTVIAVERVYDGGAKLIMYERRFPLNANDHDRLGECVIDLPSYCTWNPGEHEEEGE